MFQAPSDLRIVVPLPPIRWFGGHDLEIAAAGIAVLRRLGATVGTISADDWREPLLRPNMIAEIEAFAPHFALGIPNAGYGVHFVDEKDDSGQRLDLFTDILRIPVVLLWDHLITQAPHYFLRDRFSERPPRPGALRELSVQLGNPLRCHYVPDTAHVEIYDGLGVLPGSQMRPYIPFAMDHFVEAGTVRVEPTAGPRVGFAGNIYTSLGARLEIFDDPAVRAIDEGIRRGKHAHWDEAAWNLFCQAVDQLPDDLVERCGLAPDYPVFWKVAMELLSYSASTAHRLDVLNAIAHPVDFYGNFADPESSARFADSGNIKYCGNVDYATTLPRLFGTYPVWVDVTNAPFIRGCGAKVLNCFAAGSLMLMDFRDDLRAAVGEIADRFMFRDADDLNEKVTRYLTFPSERDAVIGAMQEVIRDRLTWHHLSARICADMAAVI